MSLMKKYLRRFRSNWITKVLWLNNKLTTEILRSKMKVKEFNDYKKTCEFRDKVNGQTQWSKYKNKPIWYVWY